MTKRLYLLAFILATLLTSASSLLKINAFDDGTVSSIGFLTSYPVMLSSTDQSTVCTGVNVSHYQKSGWPLKFEVRNIDFPGCGDAFYPIIFAANLLLFMVLIGIGLLVYKTPRK